MNNPYHTCVQPIDVEAPVRGVCDCFDVPCGGPTHMSPDDTELERLVVADEVERECMMADVAPELPLQPTAEVEVAGGA